MKPNYNTGSNKTAVNPSTVKSTIDPVTGQSYAEVAHGMGVRYAQKTLATHKIAKNMDVTDIARQSRKDLDWHFKFVGGVTDEMLRAYCNGFNGTITASRTSKKNNKGGK
ncbi:MAG: hypothetical protein ACLQF0_01335 [Dissulfurispiraceae bacterium]